MGDRCYMRVWCRLHDIERFEKLGFVEIDRGERHVEAEDDQANYAHSGDMPTDIPYLAEHDEGDEYPGMLIACDGQRCVSVMKAGNSFPVVEVTAPGIVCKPQLDDVVRYYNLSQWVRGLLGLRTLGAA